MKHYDTNESMSLKRYLIVPIAPTIILAEWLNDCISFSSVIEEQYKKDLIYQEEYKSIIDSQNNKPYKVHYFNSHLEHDSILSWTGRQTSWKYHV